MTLKFHFSTLALQCGGWSLVRVQKKIIRLKRGDCWIIFYISERMIKITVFHLKHSYLNWRVISCRIRTNCVYAIFFFNIFLNLAFLIFCFNSIEYLNCMIWQSNFSVFFFVCFFSCFYDFSTPDNDACHMGFPDWKQHFLHENCFENGCLLVQGCSCHFYPKKGLWLKSVLEKLTIFVLVNVPRGINQGWFWSIMVLGLMFLVTENDLAGLKL